MTADSCPICGNDMLDSYDAEFIRNYPGLVCRDCDNRAKNKDDNSPFHSSFGDYGDNPVFINSKKCWRRYRFGGYVTMLSPEGCNTLQDFYEQTYPEDSH